MLPGSPVEAHPEARRPRKARAATASGAHAVAEPLDTPAPPAAAQGVMPAGPDHQPSEIPTGKTPAGDGVAPAPVAPFKVEDISPELGWLLIGAGIIGIIAPGIPGAPFLVVGGMVLVPGGKKRLSRWVGDNPPKFVRESLGQLGRFVNDLESRYPRPK